ncbi:MAG: Uma2 family endonuclease [Tepidisphaeraceae bacterium]|jgi:Uma2 family endonuclease
MLATAPTARRWSLEEYYRMGESGFFRDQRVELISGEVLKMSPQGSGHFACVCLCNDAVGRCFGSNHVVRVQGPLLVGDDSEPEPDIAVVPGQPRDYTGKSHPSTALLVIEVSDTSLEFDRTSKAGLYSSAGIQDYWIVNLTDRCIEVYRNPVPDGSALFGFGYADRSVYSAQDRVKPLAAAGEIAVADILP